MIIGKQTVVQKCRREGCPGNKKGKIIIDLKREAGIAARQRFIEQQEAQQAQQTPVVRQEPEELKELPQRDNVYNGILRPRRCQDDCDVQNDKQALNIRLSWAGKERQAADAQRIQAVISTVIMLLDVPTVANIYRPNQTNGFTVEFPGLRMTSEARTEFVNNHLKPRLYGCPFVNIKSTQMIIQTDRGAATGCWDLHKWRPSEQPPKESASVVEHNLASLKRLLVSRCADDECSVGAHLTPWETRYLQGKIEAMKKLVEEHTGPMTADYSTLHTGVLACQLERPWVTSEGRDKIEHVSIKFDFMAGEVIGQKETVLLRFEHIWQEHFDRNHDAGHAEYVSKLLRDDIVVTEDSGAGYRYDERTTTWVKRPATFLIAAVVDALRKPVNFLYHMWDKYYPRKEDSQIEKAIGSVWQHVNNHSHGKNVFKQAQAKLSERKQEFLQKIDSAADSLPIMGSKVVCVASHPPVVRNRTKEDYWSVSLPVTFTIKKSTRMLRNSSAPSSSTTRLRRSRTTPWRHACK
jgi:hypothetical protein